MLGRFQGSEDAGAMLKDSVEVITQFDLNVRVPWQDSPKCFTFWL